MVQESDEPQSDQHPTPPSDRRMPSSEFFVALLVILFIFSPWILLCWWYEAFDYSQGSRTFHAIYLLTLGLTFLTAIFRRGRFGAVVVLLCAIIGLMYLLRPSFVH